MKILLAYPHCPDTFWSFRHALKFIDRKASFPPLGLLTVAAMLPREWEKRLVDMNVRPTGSTSVWVGRDGFWGTTPATIWTAISTLSPG